MSATSLSTRSLDDQRSWTAGCAAKERVAGSAPRRAHSRRGLLAFQTRAPSLVAGHTGEGEYVVLRNRAAGLTAAPSDPRPGVPADGGSVDADLTPDGRHVAFTSTAANLSAGDPDHGEDVYVRDLRTGALSRVSVSDDPGRAGGGGAAEISSDGSHIAFVSYVALVATDSNHAPDVYVRDR